MSCTGAIPKSGARPTLTKDKVRMVVGGAVWGETGPSWGLFHGYNGGFLSLFGVLCVGISIQCQ